MSKFRFMVIGVFCLWLVLFSQMIGLAENTAKAQKRVELITKRTLYTKEYQNEDGSITRHVATYPLHYLDDKGKWEEIDTNIEDASNGETDEDGEPFSFKSVKNNFKTYFPRTSKGWLSLKLGDKTGLGFKMVTKNGNLPFQKRQDKAYITEVMENCDLNLTVKNDLLKEEIIIKQPSTIKTYEFLIQLHNLNIKKAEDGSYELSDTKGTKLLSMPKFVMYDAAGNISDSIDAQLKKQGKTYRLIVIPDEKWLTDPTRKYPVTIDPSFKIILNCNYGWGDHNLFCAYIPSDNISSNTYDKIENDYHPTRWINSLGDLKPRSYAIRVFYQVFVDNKSWGYYVNEAPYFKVFTVNPSTGQTATSLAFQQFYNGDRKGSFDIPPNSGALVEMETGHQGALWQIGFYCYYDLTYYYDQEPPNPPGAPGVNDAGDGKVYINGDTIYTSYNPVPLVWNEAVDNGWQLNKSVYEVPSGGFVYGPSGIKSYSIFMDNASSSLTTITGTSYNLSLKDTERHTVSLTAIDNEGNGPSHMGDPQSIVLDQTAPTGAIHVNDPYNTPNYTSSRDVTVYLSGVSDGATGSGIYQVRVTEDKVNFSDWQDWSSNSQSQSFPYQINSSGDGSKTIYAQLKDHVGNQTSLAQLISSSITLDTTPPVNGFVNIYVDNTNVKTKNNKIYTRQLNFTITPPYASDATSGLGWMRFRNEGFCFGGYTVPEFNGDQTYKSESFNLPVGCTDGVKVIHAQYKDNAGNETDDVNHPIIAAITLDTAAPSGSITINDGAMYTNNNNVSLSLSASDGTDGIGVAGIYVCNTGKDNPDGWEPVPDTGTKSWSLDDSVDDGPRSVSVKYKDDFNHESIYYNAVINLDRTNPYGSFAIKSGDRSKTYSSTAPSNTLDVKIADISATDTPGTQGFKSGVKGIYFWNGAGNTHPNDATYYSIDALPNEGVDWTLADGPDGERVVSMEIVDNAGNSALVSRTVMLDTASPAAPELNSQTVDYTVSSLNGHKQMVFKWSVPVEGNSGLENFYIVNLSGADIAAHSLTQADGKFYGSYTKDVDAFGYNQAVTVQVYAKDNAGNSSAKTSFTGYTLAKLGTLGFTSGLYNTQTNKYELKWQLTYTSGESSSHKLEYGTISDGIFTKQGELDPNGSGMFIHGSLVNGANLQPHATYYYRLTAYNNSGKATFGTPFSQTVPNSVPTQATLTYPAGYARNGLEFQYENALDYDGDIITYRIFLGEGVNPASFVEAPKIINPTDPANTIQLVHGKIYTWYVEAKDGFGGTTLSQRVQFTVDSHAPVVTVAEPKRPYTNQSQLAVTVTDDSSGFAQNQITYKKHNINNGVETTETVNLTLGTSGTLTGNIPLPEGAYNLAVTAADRAGNETTTTITNVFTDRTLPQLTGAGLNLTLKNGRYVTGTGRIQIHFTATDGYSGIGNLCYQVKTTPGASLEEETTAPLSPGLSNYTYSLDLPGGNGQSYYLTFAVEDGAGNLSSPVQYFGPILLDKTPPEVTLTISGLKTYGSRYYLDNLNNLTAQAVAVDNESQTNAAEFNIINSTTGNLVNNWASWTTIKNTILTPGSKYQMTARAINGAGLETRKTSDEFIYDNTKPINLNLTGPTGPLAPGMQTDFQASAVEPESMITEYRLAIGSTQGGTDITAKVPGNVGGWLVLNSTVTPAHFRFEFPETANGTYYPALMVKNAAELNDSINGAAISVNNLQDRIIVSDQGPYTVFANTLTGWWSYLGASNVTAYRYRIISGENNITDWQTTTLNTVTVNDLQLINGDSYKFEVQAIFDTAQISESGFSSGVKVDTTNPEITSFVIPEYTTSNNLNLSWTGMDAESGIGRVQIALGSDYHQSDLTGGWVEIHGSPAVLSCDAQGGSLNLLNGGRYYLSLRLTNGAGETVEQVAPVIRIDDTPPPAPQVNDQGSFINPDIQPLTVDWLWTPTDPESGTVEYQWALLEDGQDINTANWQDIGTGMQASITDILQLASLLQGKTYTFAVKAKNGAGLTSIGYSNGITIDRSAPVIPNLTVFQATSLGENAAAQYITNTNNLSLWINTFDAESGITNYKYTYGVSENITEATCDQESNTAVIQLPNLTIAGNTPVIFKGIAYNGINQASQPGFSAGIILDTGAPRVYGVKSGVSGNQVYFDWEAQASSSPVAYYKVAFVSADQINSNPDAWTWTQTGLERHYSLNSDSLSNSTYYLFIKAYSQSGVSSRRGNGMDEWGVSPAVVIDSAPPNVVREGFSYARYVSAELEFHVQGHDNLSGIGGYQYALGTETNPYQFTGDWVDIENQAENITTAVSTAAIPHGTEVYLRVRVKDKVGLWSMPEISESILVDHTTPTTPVVTAGAYSTSKSSITGITFDSGDPESAVTHYRIGVVAQGTSVWIKTQTGLINQFDGSISGLNLSEVGVYQVVVQTQNGAGDWSGVGTSASITVDTITPELFFDNGDTSIVTNSPPVTVNYTVNNESEPVTVTFKLTGDDGTTENVTLQASPGQNTYTFNKQTRQIYHLHALPVDKAGNTGAEKTKDIRVNKPPVITLPAEIYTTPGKELTLSCGAVDPDGGTAYVLTYSWNPGDGGGVLSGSSPQYHYTVLGNYTLTLTVTDQDNGSASATTTVKAQNTTGGTLYLSENWKGEHHINADVTVPSGVTLTIEQGTKVIVDSLPGVNEGNNAIIIKGSLKIESGVTFSAANGSAARGWKGIYIEGAATIDGLTIKHAERGLAIIGSANVNVTNSVFRDNYVGIHVYGGASPTISNCTLQNNIWYGIKEDENGRPVVSNCYFSGNHINYYYEPLTEISMDQLNSMHGNSTNYQ